MSEQTTDVVRQTTGNPTDGAWRIVTANDESKWPCTIIDDRGRSLLGVHDGTPIIRDRALADLIVAALNRHNPPAPLLARYSNADRSSSAGGRDE